METKQIYKPGDLVDYSPELWGEALTYEQLRQMKGRLVLVDEEWYTDFPDKSARGVEIMLVLNAGTDSDGDEYIRLEDHDGKAFPTCIYPNDMDPPDDADTSYTKVWRLNESEKEMIEITTKLPPAPVEIADLNLSVRTFNAICRAGIKTIPELYHKYQLEPEWLHREIGQKHMHEVGDALALHREEVFAENRRAEKQEPLKPGDYLPDYDPELWGEEVTFEELAQMEGELVIVNDSWYPDDCPETDGEGEVMRVLHAEGDAVILDNDEPQREEIARQDMDDSVRCRYCTKVWKLKGTGETAMPVPADSTSQEPAEPINNPGALSIESACFAVMRCEFDAMLQKTLGSMIRRESDEATLTLKLHLRLGHVHDSLQHSVIRPDITHKITSAITVKDDLSGAMQGDYELLYDDDSERYFMRELPSDDGQMRLF